ncbi:hypothetical protein WJX73_006919 [Symbiochloris irregularis]|uniref:GHMP kinase N-terminal domain-containing protein n=1 Tax=Symbiochloris irregularis TaxID=706552 RepID=A0AAW1NKU6_9CHLO
MSVFRCQLQCGGLPRYEGVSAAASNSGTVSAPTSELSRSPWHCLFPWPAMLPVRYTVLSQRQLPRSCTYSHSPLAGTSSESRGTYFSAPMETLFPGGVPLEYDKAQQYFKRLGDKGSWAAYIAGALLVLAHERSASFPQGVSLLVASAVPEGAGVSSSASVEVAAMAAVAAAHSLSLEPYDLAVLCQKVENCVVGAPCGVMDQMAAALGQAGCLMALTCQPAQVHPAVQIPKHMAFWGIDSGQRHSVGGADYGTVRAAAFMGLHMVTHRRLTSDNAGQPGQEEVAQQAGYLAEVSPSEFASRFASDLPHTMSGSDFHSTLSHHLDSVTSVHPQGEYPVLAATRHPIEENFRVSTFRALLQGNTGDPVTQMTLLGELMFQSHESYSSYHWRRLWRYSVCSG